MAHETVDEQAPIISLPTDTQWQALLQRKLEQYNQRLNSPDYRYLPPELRESTQTGYGKLILEELLGGRPVNTYDLSRRLYNDQFLFRLSEFEKACKIVDRYTSDRQVLIDSLNMMQQVT